MMKNNYFYTNNVSDLISVIGIMYEMGYIGYNQEKEIKKILEELKKYKYVLKLEWDIYLGSRYAAIGDFIDYIESLIDVAERKVPEDKEIISRKIYEIIEIIVGKKF